MEIKTVTRYIVNGKEFVDLADAEHYLHCKKVSTILEERLSLRYIDDWEDLIHSLEEYGYQITEI